MEPIIKGAMVVCSGECHHFDTQRSDATLPAGCSASDGDGEPCMAFYLHALRLRGEALSRVLAVSDSGDGE